MSCSSNGSSLIMRKNVLLPALMLPSTHSVMRGRRTPCPSGKYSSSAICLVIASRCGLWSMPTESWRRGRSTSAPGTRLGFFQEVKKLQPGQGWGPHPQVVEHALLAAGVLEVEGLHQGPHGGVALSPQLLLVLGPHAVQAAQILLVLGLLPPRPPPGVLLARRGRLAAA